MIRKSLLESLSVRCGDECPCVFPIFCSVLRSYYPLCIDKTPFEFIIDQLQICITVGLTNRRWRQIVPQNVYPTHLPFTKKYRSRKIKKTLVEIDLMMSYNTSESFWFRPCPFIEGFLITFVFMHSFKRNTKAHNIARSEQCPLSRTDFQSDAVFLFHHNHRLSRY